MDSADFNSPESWQIARQYASLLGDIPSSFTTTTRSLIVDGEKNNGVLGKSAFPAKRLIKGPTLKAAVYFAALTYFPQKLDGLSYVSDDKLLQTFRSDELAALMGLTYIYKRINKICDADEWEYVAKPLHIGIDIGGHVGAAIPAIGLVVGTFTDSMRFLAMGCFLKHDKKAFKEHRRKLKSQGAKFSSELEMGTWGCTSLQIGSIFIQTIGFGVALANYYVSGLTPSSLNTQLDKQALAFRNCEMWITALYNTGKQPETAIDSRFYPVKDNMAILAERGNAVRTKGSPYEWLTKSKQDLSPEATPALYKPAGASRAVPVEAVPVEVETDDAAAAAIISEQDLQKIDSDLDD